MTDNDEDNTQSYNEEYSDNSSSFNVAQIEINNNTEYKRMLKEYMKVENGTVGNKINSNNSQMDYSSNDFKKKAGVYNPDYFFDFDTDFDIEEDMDEFTEALRRLVIPKLVVYKNEIVLLYVTPEKNRQNTTLFKKNECNDFALIFKSFLRGNITTIPFSRIIKCVKTKDNEFVINYTGKSSFNTNSAIVLTKYTDETDYYVMDINILKNY